MEASPWSAKLPFSYILNVWEGGTQAQDLPEFFISILCSLPYHAPYHLIMTSLDLWSKKKHLSKAGCNGLLPNPRQLHPNRKEFSIFRNRVVIHIGTELRNRNHLSSFNLLKHGLSMRELQTELTRVLNQSESK